MHFQIILFGFLTIFGITHAFTYEPCSLLKEVVIKHSFTVQDALGFVCMADKISGFNTVYAGSNHGFGIFGIQSGKACEFSKPGLCGFTCDKLLDDDIEDDLSCLEVILQRTKKRPKLFKECEEDKWEAYANDCVTEMQEFGEKGRKEAGKFFNLKNFRYEDEYFNEKQDFVVNSEEKL